MKLLYYIPETSNQRFAIYYMYYKEKLGMRELVYNLYFFFIDLADLAL